MDATTFHDMLVTEFQLHTLPVEEQTSYVDQIGELVLQGVIVKALSALDAQHVADLDRFIDEGKNPGQVMEYLHDIIPGLSDLIHDEVIIIKNELASETDHPID